MGGDKLQEDSKEIKETENVTLHGTIETEELAIEKSESITEQFQNSNEKLKIDKELTKKDLNSESVKDDAETSLLPNAKITSSVHDNDSDSITTVSKTDENGNNLKEAVQHCDENQNKKEVVSEAKVDSVSAKNLEKSTKQKLKPKKKESKTKKATEENA